MVFPYPRSLVADEDIFFDPAKADDQVVAQKFYQRKISKNAKIYKSQYISIEDTLIRAFQFVSPAKANAQTFSVEFASIIKESANLYELISKNIYTQLYTCTNEQIKNLKIKNYLSLDVYLNFSHRTLDSLLFFDRFNQSVEIYHPFNAISAWDRNSQIQDTHIPRWWTAYNKLKHTGESLELYATLENAITALGAIFIVINTVYGPGVVYGALLEPNNVVNFGIGSRVFQLL